MNEPTDRQDAANGVAYAFVEFRLDPGRRLLMRHGERVPVAPRVLDTLVELVRHRGSVVTKDALLRAVWGDAIVEENNLNQAISALRRALQDPHGDNRFIVTHPGRGYAFVGDVEIVKSSAPREDGPITIAVLPFDNLSGEPDREYFADGLTEETLTALGRVDPVHLAVLSRSAVLPYKHAGSDFARIGRELGATYVVEGSLRAEGAVLRTTARLIRTRDRKQVWSASFDGEPASVLDFQRELATAIAHQIRLNVEPSRLAAMGRRQSQSAEAFDFYLRGRHAWHRLTPATTRHALDMYRRATAIDPDYALAWSGMADAYCTSPVSGDAEPAVVRPLAREAAAHALRAEPELAEAQVSAGFYSFWLDWDWAASEAAFLRASELDAAYAAAWRMLGQQYAGTRRFDEAQHAMRRCRELDPFLPVHHALSAGVAYWAGDYEACARFARQALALDPGFWIGHFHYVAACEQIGDRGMLERAVVETLQAPAVNSKLAAARAHALVRLGREEEARQVLATLTALSHERYVPGWSIALVHIGLGERDAALQCIERSVEARGVELWSIRLDARWSAVLREDPRLEALLQRCAFSDHQLGAHTRS